MLTLKSGFKGFFGDKELSNILGEDKGGLAYWVACIRECFEEAGILIAYREDGSPFDPSDSEERERFVDYRNRLNAGEAVLENMCEEENLTLATARLAYLAHWITPKICLLYTSTSPRDS